MVAGVVLEVGIAQVVAGTDDQRCSQLERTAAGVALAVAGDRRPEPGQELSRRDEVEGTGCLRACDLSRGSVLVQQNGERDGFVLDERFGVAFPAGPDGRDLGTGLENLLVPVADLTGPLATGQSAKVTEKENHLRSVRPQVTEPHRVLVRVDHNGVRQSCQVEGHGGRVGDIRTGGGGRGCRGCSGQSGRSCPPRSRWPE